MVEVARLESVYRLIAYRGFESPSLRHKLPKALKLLQGFFHFEASWKQSPCGLCVGDSKLFASDANSGTQVWYESIGLINTRSMPNLDHRNNQFRIFNLINNSVVSAAHSIQF